MIATYNGDANYTTVSGTCNDANEQVVVSPATPAIATQVSNATRTLGQSFTDTATVTVPATGSGADGQRDVRRLRARRHDCTRHAGVHLAEPPADGLGRPRRPAAFTPQAPGTYRVIATYNGDANYTTISGLCNDANEQVVVSQATPGISTQVSNPTRTLGQSFTDTATVTFPARRRRRRAA